MNKRNMKDKVESTSEIKVHTVTLTSRWDLSAAVEKLTQTLATKLGTAYFNLVKPFWLGFDSIYIAKNIVMNNEIK